MCEQLSIQNICRIRVNFFLKVGTEALQIFMEYNISSPYESLLQKLNLGLYLLVYTTILHALHKFWFMKSVYTYIDEIRYWRFTVKPHFHIISADQGSLFTSGK